MPTTLKNILNFNIISQKMKVGTLVYLRMNKNPLVAERVTCWLFALCIKSNRISGVATVTYLQVVQQAGRNQRSSAFEL